jgi:glycosyltransferase involved in cell wall biosynthesis
MMEEKGVYDLLEACSILKQRNHHFTCHFVGQWSDISEDMFNMKVKELNLESYVHAFGGQYGKDKEKFFTKADIFIFPTYYHNEAFSLVNLEAMQYGLPVISTREGGIPDVVEDGVTGYLVNKMDPQDLADKIEILIQQPSLRQKMGMAGMRKYQNNYTLQIWEENLNNILNQIIIESIN